MPERSPEDEALRAVAADARAMLFDLVRSASESRAEAARLAASVAASRKRRDAEHRKDLDRKDADLQSLRVDAEEARASFELERAAFRHASAEYERQIRQLANSLDAARYEARKLRKSREDLLQSWSWRATKFLRAASDLRAGRRRP